MSKDDNMGAPGQILDQPSACDRIPRRTSTAAEQVSASCRRDPNLVGRSPNRFFAPAENLNVAAASAAQVLTASEQAQRSWRARLTKFGHVLNVVAARALEITWQFGCNKPVLANWLDGNMLLK